jgi:hypothetical protein
MIRSDVSSAHTGISEWIKIRKGSYTYYMLYVKQIIPPDIQNLAYLMIFNFRLYKPGWIW